MLTIKESMLRPISIGYVAANKLRNTPEVEIILAEYNPFADGEVVDGIEILTIDGVTPTGDAQSFKVQVSNTIRATWLGDGTQRISAPDVRRGERVEVLQYSNIDKFYWRIISEPGINTRKKETIIEAVSNTTDEKQTELTPENSWYKEFSTHDKRITLKTNKSDGERWAYTIQLDAKAGNMVFADDTGMYVQVNSEEESIELGTTSGGLVKLVKRVLEFDVDDWKVKANKATFNIGETQWNGSVDYTIGSYTFNANVAFTKTVKHNGKSIGTDHVHKNVRTGDDDSGQVR